MLFTRRELSTLVLAGRQVTLRTDLLAGELALLSLVVGKAVEATSTSSAVAMLAVTIHVASASAGAFLTVPKILPWSLVLLPLLALFVVGSITAHELVGGELTLLVLRRVVHVVGTSLVATSEA